jgi:DNA-binding transcriptional LysR family regulator
MELRRLRYFLDVAREGSLGGASRAIGIAQPALGRQIQLLEAELGVKLFERTPRGMQLTEEGQYLKDALDHPLGQLDLALQNVRNYAARIEVALTLGLSAPFARLLGPRLFLRLGSELPKLKLRVVEDGPSRLAADLLRGVVDIAILSGVTPDDRVFRAEVLREDLLLVGAPGSALDGLESVPFAELHRFPLILPGRPDGLPTQLEKTAAGNEVRITIASEVDSIELAKEVVKAGAVFAILPPLAFRDEAARSELVSARITAPALEQLVLYAVQPHWRVARSTYNEVERVIFDVWSTAVHSGEWPAAWIFDDSRLSINAGRA